MKNKITNRNIWRISKSIILVYSEKKYFLLIITINYNEILWFIIIIIMSTNFRESFVQIRKKRVHLLQACMFTVTII